MQHSTIIENRAQNTFNKQKIMSAKEQADGFRDERHMRMDQDPGSKSSSMVAA